MAVEILHETANRLRVALPEDLDLDALPADLKVLSGVRRVRVNRRLRCVSVEYDGQASLRRTLLQRLERGHAGARVGPRRAGARGAAAEGMARGGAPGGPAAADDGAAAAAAATSPVMAAAAARAATGLLGNVAAAATAAVAASVPLLPREWRTGAALGSIALRVAATPARLREDPMAVVLDSVSLAALALGNQAPVVSASVLLRLLSERLSDRFVRQADDLLAHLLPTEADRYRALRDPAEREGWWPLRRLRAGDRLRLFPGDVVPLDGMVTDGEAELASVLPGGAARQVRTGDPVAAGERLQSGTLELRAEADAEHSRLERLRAQLRHALAARDPVGRLAPSGARLMSLPVTAAALVFGFTGDSTRAATMLQADPQQGLDLTQPVAREASLFALARSGLVTSGLEVVSRLAQARTLVLQDTGVLASGRWSVESIAVERGGNAAQVRRWLARWAGQAGAASTPCAAPARRRRPAAKDSAALADGADGAPSFPDRVVRDWHRHGAVLRLRGHEVHLASRQRLQALWGLGLPPAPVVDDTLRREFACVADGRVVARVVLATPWRDGWRDHLAALHATGFERIALAAEIDEGAPDDAAAGAGATTQQRPGRPQVDMALWLAADNTTRGDWLAEATADGSVAVVVHTQLRDLVPPGSLGLAPLAAEAGPHGVLVGDPLASLLAARRVAQTVDRRLRRHQTVAAAGNAAMLTASALRLLPPMATALMHHGLALLLLLDSLRLEALGGGEGDVARSLPGSTAEPTPAALAKALPVN
jgi:cation transport ATPase